MPQEEQILDVNGIFKQGLIQDMKDSAGNRQVFVSILNNSTLLALGRGGLPGTLAGLATASHIPESNPYPAPK